MKFARTRSVRFLGKAKNKHGGVRLSSRPVAESALLAIFGGLLGTQFREKDTESLQKYIETFDPEAQDGKVTW